MIVRVHLHEYSLPRGTGNAHICRVECANGWLATRCDAGT